MRNSLRAGARRLRRKVSLSVESLEGRALLSQIHGGFGRSVSRPPTIVSTTAATPPVTTSTPGHKAMVAVATNASRGPTGRHALGRSHQATNDTHPLRASSNPARGPGGPQALARRNSPSRLRVNAYRQINLVSDFPLGVEGVNAQIQDPNLLNPWGMAFTATSPVWVSDQVTGVATLYSVDQAGVAQKVPLTVTIPSQVTQPAHGFNPLTGPTGIVSNATSDFQIPSPTGSVPAPFIFSTLDGTIAGWNPGSTGGMTNAVVMVNQGPAEEFTGLAMASSGGRNFLYTADPRFLPGISVFDSQFTKVTLAGNFTNPRLPAGFAPYNIQNINGRLFVTYLTTASGGGVVAEFNADGTFVRQFAANGPAGPLQAPWGLALAPADFGRFSNALLVGNFGDGRINAYNFRTGRFLGQLADTRRRPIVIPNLWALRFGNGQAAGATNTLLFTAGVAGQFHGLFGSLQAVRPFR